MKRGSRISRWLNQVKADRRLCASDIAVAIQLAQRTNADSKPTYARVWAQQASGSPGKRQGIWPTACSRFSVLTPAQGDNIIRHCQAEILTATGASKLEFVVKLGAVSPKAEATTSMLPHQRVQCDRFLTVAVPTAKRSDHWGAALQAWLARPAAVAPIAIANLRAVHRFAQYRGNRAGRMPATMERKAR